MVAPEDADYVTDDVIGIDIHFPNDAVYVDRRNEIFEDQVYYPDLPRSGLLAPRLLRTGLPASMSELTSNVDTPVLDFTGDFPSRAVRGDPLLPNRHSATTNGARFLSRLNTVKHV